MRILAVAFGFTFVAATSAFAMSHALTEQQVEGVQKAIKAMGCTVADADIEMENGGYEADDVLCGDGNSTKKYDVYLDKDFNVTKKVEE